MSRLQTMEKVVLEILEENQLARADDYFLIHCVCKKLCPEIICEPFGKAMILHKEFEMPNWETVTRCRRKIQEKRPDLDSPDKVRMRRLKEELLYREYART